MDIVITERAREVLVEKEVGAEKFLRVKIVEGGCAGLTYDAEIDSNLQGDESVIFQDANIRIVSDKKSHQYMDGLNVDYSDDLVSAGLRITNAKSVSTCGCGSSFNLSGFPVIENGKCAK